MPVYIDLVWLDAHAAELGQGPLSLPHNGALESDQHEQGEQRVVPVFIQHPQSDAEDLEDEEGRNGVFLEQLGEGRDGDIEFVCAIMLCDALNLSGRGETLGLLERLELGLGFDIEGIGERGEGTLVGIVEETSLLEEEREVRLSTNVVAHQWHNLSGAGILDRLDFDKRCRTHVAGRGGGECALEVNVPVRHEPEQRLEGGDAGNPHKSPFRRLNVLLVALRRKVYGGEGRPYY